MRPALLSSSVCMSAGTLRPTRVCRRRVSELFLLPPYVCGRDRRALLIDRHISYVLGLYEGRAFVKLERTLEDMAGLAIKGDSDRRSATGCPGFRFAQALPVNLIVLAACVHPDRRHVHIFRA